MFGFIKKILGTDNMKVQAFRDKGAIILDVRTPQEYQSGHVAGSMNIPLQSIGSQLKKIQRLNKPVITCCASGMRSGVAARQLNAAGIEAVNGGAWTAVKG
jgi:rhodanese-related sulfurtransferase